MSEFCEHCDYYLADPSPARCPGCRIKELENEIEHWPDLVGACGIPTRDGEDVLDGVKRVVAENERLREALGLLMVDFEKACGTECPHDPSGSRAYVDAKELLDSQS